MKETIERCDICGRVVSEPLKDAHDRSLYGDARGYTVRVKRVVWSFSSVRWWHRRTEPEPEIVCDWCWDRVRALAATEETQPRRGQPVDAPSWSSSWATEETQPS